MSEFIPAIILPETLYPSPAPIIIARVFIIIAID